MGARLWTALLVLAAVFAVHGVQCTTAADGAGHAATPAGHAATPATTGAHAVSIALTALSAGHAHAGGAAGIVLAGPVLAGPVLAGPVLADPVLPGPVLAGPVLADPVPVVSASGHGNAGSEHAGAAAVLAGHAGAAAVLDGHAGAPHGPAAHLWTLCLAVLAAALAVLLAWLDPRSVRSAASALVRTRARLHSAAPPRPPDLSVLCLLRI